MQYMSISGDKYKENLKQAAEFLLKGGTLLSEPCDKCNGIQIKKNNEVTCIICGNTTTLKEPKSTEDIDKTVDKRILPDSSISEKIGERLEELIMNIGSDKNFDEEEQRLRVIDIYIKILEKIKVLK
jgi:uncharacterized Zn finger protein (UPF0148 family)